MQQKAFTQISAIFVLFLMVVSFPIHGKTEVTVNNVADVGGWPECAVFNGNTAYFAQGKKLVIFNTSDGQLLKLGSIMLEEEPERMILQGDFIYAMGTRNLRIIDISTPLTPVLRGTVDHANAWNPRLTISGNHVYAVINDGVWIADVSNVDAPQEIATFEPEAREVAVSGQTLLVGKENGLTLYDITDPVNLVEKGTLASPRVNALDVMGSSAYVGHDVYPDIGLAIVDISDIDNPNRIGWVDTKVVDGNHTTYLNPQIVSVAGNHAYIGCSGSAYLFIADLTDPANPVITGYTQFIESERFPSFGSIHIAEPYVFIVTNGGIPGFFVIDVADKAVPILKTKLNEPWTIMHLEATGDTLFLAGENDLWIYRVTDPEEHDVTLIKVDENWGGMRRLFYHKDRLYGIKEDTLYILDATDLTSLQLLGTYTTPYSFIRELHVLDGNVYILSLMFGSGMMEIIDVTDPAAPVQSGEWQLPGEGRDIWATEGSRYVYAAFRNPGMDTGGFQILDVTDPASITLMSNSVSSARPMCITVEENLLCLGSINTTDGTWFLEAFNVQDKSAPLKMAEQTGTGTIWDVMIRDNVIVASIPENCCWFFFGLAYLYDNDADFREFDDFMFELVEVCPSPASMFIEMLFYWAASEYMWIVSIDGSGCKDLLDCYASLGAWIQFWAKMFDSSVEGREVLPESIQLHQNYPNPFNPSTTIPFTVARTTVVSIKIYDNNGRFVMTLLDDTYQPGTYSIQFQADGLPAGIYHCRIKAGHDESSQKMVLMK